MKEAVVSCGKGPGQAPDHGERSPAGRPSHVDRPGRTTGTAFGFDTDRHAETGRHGCRVGHHSVPSLRLPGDGATCATVPKAGRAGSTLLTHGHAGAVSGRVASLGS